jgi:hypothetical protein
LHLIKTVPNEIARKVTKVKNLVGKVRGMMGVIVPAYRSDEGRKTFKQVSETREQAAGRSMSKKQGCALDIDSMLPVMSQLLELEHNYSGPHLNLF